jgi:hypothetical protein
MRPRARRLLLPSVSVLAAADAPKLRRRDRNEDRSHQGRLSYARGPLTALRVQRHPPFLQRHAQSAVRPAPLTSRSPPILEFLQDATVWGLVSRSRTSAGIALGSMSSSCRSDEADDPVGPCALRLQTGRPLLPGSEAPLHVWPWGSMSLVDGVVPGPTPRRTCRTRIPTGHRKVGESQNLGGDDIFLYTGILFQRDSA